MSLFGTMLSGFVGGDSKTPRRRNLLDETLASRPKKPDPKPFSLSDSVGVYGSNHPKDVKKMERGLDSLGFMNTKKTGDSKGQFSAQLRQGMQAFQKANNLAVDGQANANGPTATTLSQQVKKIRERRAAEKKQARKTKPLTPKPLAPKPTPAPAFQAKPKPWWQTRKPEKMPDEDYSSTRRTLEGMLKYGDDGDLPNLYADSIRDSGHKAANEMGEFMRQLEEAAPKRMKGFEKAVFNMLNDYQKKTYFPEVFGKKPEKKSLLQQASFRQGDDGDRRNADTPIHKRFLGQDDGKELRIKTAQNTSTGGDKKVNLLTATEERRRASESKNREDSSPSALSKTTGSHESKKYPLLFEDKERKTSILDKVTGVPGPDFHERNRQKKKLTAERKQAILTGGKGNFSVKPNPKADDSKPWYTLDDYSEVKDHNKLIDRKAKEAGVDPNLVRSIVHLETTQGWYDRYAPSGKHKTIRPMNVHAEYWKELGYSRKDLNDPEKNIEAGVKLLKKIQSRIPGATVEQVGSVYNSLGVTKVNDYGARLKKLYREKPWVK